MRYLSLVIACICFVSGYAQTVDSSKVLTPEYFMNLVRLYHPVVKQANLKLDVGNANLLKARGGFDPKLGFGMNQKQFTGKEYFNLMNGTLSVPTFFGVEFKGGYDRNQGLYLNPENTVPAAGLTYAGLSVTLGQGLFIDERRAALKQAQIFKNSTQSERAIILNDLMYEAGKAYWDWFSAYHSLEVYKDAYQASTERLESVRQFALLGDRPFIDTLEAYIQRNEREFSLIQARLQFKNKTIELSNYLWTEELLAVELDETTQAPGFDDYKLPEDMLMPDSTMWMRHPELIFTQLKIQNLQVERKWKAEQIKPVLNLAYQPYFTSPSVNSYSMNDYKFGLTFRMPLLLRKERGDLRLAEFKIKEATWDFTIKQQQIRTKNLTAINEFTTTIELINQYSLTVNAYGRLLDSEKSIFQAGESSLFMINARELSYIGAQLKLIDVVVKNRKAILGANYAAGLLSF